MTKKKRFKRVVEYDKDLKKDFNYASNLILFCYIVSTTFLLAYYGAKDLIHAFGVSFIAWLLLLVSVYFRNRKIYYEEI